MPRKVAVEPSADGPRRSARNTDKPAPPPKPAPKPRGKKRVAEKVAEDAEPEDHNDDGEPATKKVDFCKLELVTRFLNLSWLF
jgi:hypothetical protein